MKKITADWIFTLTGTPLKNGVITVNDEGVITDIDETFEKTKDQELPEFHKGIIVPGFVNCHCHLELSHLKGRICEKQGISSFIGEINRKRIVPEEDSLLAARDADHEMFFQGISGVGDISNTDLTVEIKKLSKISYFTFIEVFGFHPSRAGKAIALALDIREKFSEASLPSSIVPHSPFSVSDQLFEKIDHLPDSECSILTIHNQEDAEENRFFRSGDGPILDHLINNLGIDTSHWHPSGKNSLETTLPKLPAQKPLLLVHNTFSTIQDIAFLKNNHPADKTFIVLCPNSNLFISNQLPAVNLFRSEKLQICIGTDSLASNSHLSVLSELITLQHQFPDVRLEEMLIWACANGANALGMKDRLGTIEVGKKPCFVLISDIDLKNLKFTSGSWVKRLA